MGLQIIRESCLGCHRATHTVDLKCPYCGYDYYDAVHGEERPPKFVYFKNWLGRVLKFHKEDKSVTAEFHSSVENAPCYVLRVWNGEWKDAEAKV